MKLYSSKQVKRDIDKFLKTLKRHAKNWRSPDFLVRTIENHCPISFVAAQRGIKDKPLSTRYACEVMGIGDEARRIIIDAADGVIVDSKGVRARVRARILKAIGL